VKNESLEAIERREVEERNRLSQEKSGLDLSFHGLKARKKKEVSSYTKREETIVG